MADIQELKAGQQVALKGEGKDAIPPIHGAVTATEGGRIRIRVDEASHDNIEVYRPELRCVLVWNDRGRGEQAPIQIASRDGDNLQIVPEAAGDMRGSSRIATNAVFTYELLAPEKVEAAILDVRNAVGEPPDETLQIERLMGGRDDVWEKMDEEFSRMTRQVAELSSKLDYLIDLGEGRSPREAIRRYMDILDLSGTGMSFIEKKPLPLGSKLLISIELSRFPRLVVPCIGEVARSAPTIGRDGAATGVFHIGVHFIEINEDERERIIHYIFKIQRRSLRNRKEQR